MKIYTKKGDAGLTSLIAGAKVAKSDLRIECYGTVDELNSCLGMLTTLTSSAEVRHALGKIQNCLFVVGSLLACDSQEKTMTLPELKDSDVAFLEGEIDRMTATLPELKSFILPGGTQPGAWAHVSRSVCRRAERLVVALSQKTSVNGIILVYLNRLSDYLFVLARRINHDESRTETIWKPEH